MIDDKMKKFLQEHIDLIDNDNFTALYEELAFTIDITPSQLTTVLVSADIDPLKYMSAVPELYASFLSSPPFLKKQLILPNNISKIESWAFLKTLLEEVIIPNTVTNIGVSAFLGAEIKKLHIPQKINIIRAYICKDCSMLEEVYLPKSVKEIKPKAFESCVSLRKITYEGTEESLAEINIADNCFQHTPADCKIYFTENGHERTLLELETEGIL